jgi:rhamnose transport system substrate-binding protein
VAIVSSSPTAPNQTAWIQAMDAYRGKNYPKLKVVTTEFGEESQKTSQEKAETILKVYPKVKGIWGLSSAAFPGAAKAVEDAHEGGQVAVVGVATPNPMKDFVKKGVVKSVILWNTVDLGYLTIQVAHAVVKGELKPGATTFHSGRLKDVKVKGDMVILGDPMVFTKENIDQYDF